MERRGWEGVGRAGMRGREEGLGWVRMGLGEGAMVLEKETEVWDPWWCSR